jgi:NADPH:quinone reductase-like Zn-dependent oxidoreductase/NADP-dependent 3-hydroxy acid dehydrogenase YdfG
LTPGQRVIASAPMDVSSHVQIPEWTCCPLLDSEEFQSMSTIAVVYGSAIYAIKQRANLQPGETILIHSAAGGLGIAAIQIAKLLGATSSEIFATVGTEKKRRFLVDNFGLHADQIFSSRDPSFLADLMRKTDHRGVDVVINSLTGPLLHESWKACAEFGRFVEVGKKDILDDGLLRMQQFKKSVTFTAFDLDSLYYSPQDRHHSIRRKLVEETLQLLRQGKITHITPLKVFDISEIQEAYRYFQRGSRMGKVCLSLENPSSVINVVRAKYQTRFSPEKVYFLAGCLGGIGRSISKWMVRQGAKKLAFLNRSNSIKPTTKQFLDDLQRSRVEITVIRGNVNSSTDVADAIRSLQSPIGGVIHAAMDLDEKLFDAMSAESWHLSIDPKVWGTWNIHNALQGRDNDLDFFLMTSSLTGSVGMATESNYCAANSFQDAFARYRRSLGLPGTALGIGMIQEVGYLHEHPQIEAMLLRKGLHPLSEAELIRIIDMSLSNQTSRSRLQVELTQMEGHLLMGLETLGLQRQRQLGFEGENHFLNDPRSAAIRNTLENVERIRGSSLAVATAGITDHPSKRIEKILAAQETGESLDAKALGAMISSILTKKLCHLLLLTPDQLHPSSELGNLGIDSMLAAEFRTFIFTTIGADISFQILLEHETTVASLTELALSLLGVTM